MEDWKSEFYKKYSTYFGTKFPVDLTKISRPYGRHIIKSCFPINKDARILDMGCGKGGFIQVALEYGYSNILGVDVSDEDVSFAHEMGIHQVKQGEIVEYLNLTESETFDVVLYLDVIEHFIRPEILTILKESYRILKPGGVIIIHVPNAEGFFGSRIRYSDITHEQAFTSKSLSQILTYSGFKSFKCFEDKPLFHSIVSTIRRVIWEVSTLPIRLIHAAETGVFTVSLSQNILFRAIK